MEKLYKKYCLLVWGFLVGMQVSAQNLESYLQIAAENNPKVKAAYAEFEAALRQSPQVSSLPDPTLTIGAFGRMMQSDMGAEEAKISLMQMFPWFGTLEAKREAAVLMAEAEFQEYLDVRNQVFYDVKEAYAELYQVSGTIELQKENQNILEAKKDLALSGIRSGKASMVSVVGIEINLDAAATEIAILQDQLRPMRADFNLLLNRPVQEEIAVQDTLLFSFPKELASQETFEDHPSLQKLQKQKEAYELQQEVARKEGMPQLGIGLDYTINSKTPSGMHDMNGQDLYMPMLSVSLPIFRKKYKAAREEAEFREEVAVQQQVLQENELISDYEMAKYELSTAQKLLDLYERQIRSSLQANELLVSAFSNSTGSFEEVLDMNQSILLLRMQQLEALKKGFTAQARLDYLFSKTSGNEQEQ